MEATDEFLEINWNQRELNSLLKKIWETGSTEKNNSEGMGVADQSMHILKRT